jgi:hypothetical protein
VTGTFLWVLALTAGSILVVYSGICAALIPLRRCHPNADALQLPFGSAFATAGILIALGALTQLEWRQVLLMGVTSLFATGHWWWAKRHATPAARSLAA